MWHGMVTTIHMRTVFIIISVGILAAAVWLFVANYHGSAGSISFTELAQGEQSSVSQRANYLITSQSELASLWNLIKAPSSNIPIIDFTKNNVIAVFSGIEPYAGAAIAVSRIEDSSTKRIVEVSITKPDCAAAQATTSPYQVVEVGKTPLTLTHVDQVRTITCPN